MEKEKKEKNTKQREGKGIKTTSFQTTLIVILLICVAALGGWIVGASRVNVMYKEAINSKESSGENKITTTTNNNNNNTTNDVTTAEDEIKQLDLSKSLNTNGVTYSDAKELTNGNTDIGLTVKVNGNSAKLAINWSEFGPHSGASAWSQDIKEYEIRNLSGTIKEGYVGENGQSAVGTALFYLMDDGTVEYTKVFAKQTDNAGNSYYNVNYTFEKNSEDRITGEHFESQGKVNGVKDVVKLYVVNASSGMSGYVTTIAATKDGSFYDLGNEINK